ncbi:hypothetical protein J7E93_08155 [Streptomyces sp. ISL-36]|uniref:hypothetical protein n=1 Tax=Streptomyces sp. ISL-36 TaxID=2819182 RepID=UPI001BE5E2E4|nr:hypothetical protein [Streptomyces sp. ISL-36]MBT2440091.1 hypothetical protein [Streptomyces sp. ISL-36]
MADLVEPRLVAKYLPGDGDGGGDAVAGDALDADLGAGEIYYLQPCSGCHGHVGVGTVGGVVFAVEFGGSTGAVPGVLRDLSRGSWCFGLKFGISGGTRVYR